MSTTNEIPFVIKAFIADRWTHETGFFMSTSEMSTEKAEIITTALNQIDQIRREKASENHANILDNIAGLSQWIQRLHDQVLTLKDSIRIIENEVDKFSAEDIAEHVANNISTPNSDEIRDIVSDVISEEIVSPSYSSSDVREIFSDVLSAELHLILKDVVRDVAQEFSLEVKEKKKAQ